MSRVPPAAAAEARRITGAIDPLALWSGLAGRNLPVLLQSSPESGRHSILASDPFLVLRWHRGRGSLRGFRREEVFEGDPFPVLRALLDEHRVEKVPGLPFAGGAIGYLGYGLRQFTGAREGRLAPSSWPDLHLAFYDQAIVVDHGAGCTHLVASGVGAQGEARRLEKRRLDLLRLRALLDEAPDRKPREPLMGRGVVRFRTPRVEYLRRIERAREYLAAGDIYQVNLSHRIEIEGAWDPAALYRRLVEAHPSAFGAFVPLPEGTILCASPERFVRLSGRRAETRPIKGTRARVAGDQRHDAAAAEALVSGPKERAENVMIVDLARNDLGRVCVPGSVQVEALCAVETLPSVHHLVSRVSGRLREEADGIDLVRALFPGGSMTGAPKLRAMEIIDELEGLERGVYAGSLGYFSLDGDLDLNIVIRTLLVSAGRAELQVGGAVLAESDPEAEYQETLDKARPLLELLSGAERGGGSAA